MKKIMCFMMAFAMIFTLLTNFVQAAETGVLARVSGEDFTGLVIAEATQPIQSLALSGENGLAARNMRVNNAAVSLYYRQTCDGCVLCLCAGGFRKCFFFLPIWIGNCK